MKDDSIFDPPYRSTEERDEFYRMMKESDERIYAEWERHNTNPVMYAMALLGLGIVAFAIGCQVAEWLGAL